MGWLIDPGVIYASALAVGGWVYAVQVRGPPRWLEMGLQAPQPKEVRLILESFNRLIEQVERDYERRAGWLGALSGLIGVTSAYFLFGALAAYGILGLILTDGLSSIFGISLGRRRIPMTDATVEGTVAGFISYALVLVVITRDPTISILIPAASSIAELYVGEDNITVPLAASLAAALTGAPLLLS